MKLFLDTNILIDVLARREGFYDAASNVIQLGITGEVSLSTTSMSLATTLFVTRKTLGYDNALAALKALEPYIEIASMDATQCHTALHAPMPDFEDNLQYEAAQASECDIIITRNKKHFLQESIPVMTPIEFLTLFHSSPLSTSPTT